MKKDIFNLDTIAFYAFEDKQKSVEDFKNARFNNAIMLNALYALQVNKLIEVFGVDSLNFIKKALESNNRQDLAHFANYFGKNFNDHFNFNNIVFEKVYKKGVILKDVLKVTFTNVKNEVMEAYCFLNSVTFSNEKNEIVTIGRTQTINK